MRRSISLFQVLKRFFYIRVMLCIGILCNLFRLQHGSNGFFFRLFQMDFKRKATDAKRLTHENMDGCSEIRPQLAVQRLTLLLEITIHTNIEIGCGGLEISSFVARVPIL